MQEWRLILSGRGSASFNMAFDEALSEAVCDIPVLRFYFWDKPSLSIGYFQNPFKEINIGYCSEAGIPIVRRITGGRGVFHKAGLTYSLIASVNHSFFPKDLKGSLKVISDGISGGLKEAGVPCPELFVPKSREEKKKNLASVPFCFGSLSVYEIAVNGKKLVGCAQRRTGNIIIQQGYIPYDNGLDELGNIFKSFDKDSVKDNITSLNNFIPEKTFTQGIGHMMKKGFENSLGITLKQADPKKDELETAYRLEKEKYLNNEWNLYRKQGEKKNFL